MNIGSSWYMLEHVLTQSKSECVAHSVDKDVGDEQGESIPCQYHGTEGLAEKGEMRPGRRQNPVSFGQVKKSNCWRMKRDVEAVLYDNQH